MTKQVPTSEIETLHRTTLLDGITNLRDLNLLTDVTLNVNGKIFYAHKCILASSSNYFKALFTDGLLESNQTVIHLNGISSAGIKTVLDFLYTSRIHLTQCNVQDVLATASYTQVLAIVKACENFLKVHLDNENCTDVATIADTYCLNDLKHAVFNFVSLDFIAIAKTKDYCRLSPEQIEYVVSRDMPVDVTELEFLNYILKWFLEGNQTDIQRKQEHAEKILKHIRFYEIIPSELESMLDKLYYASKMRNKTESPLYEMIMKISHQPDNSLQLPLLKNTFNTRGMELALVKVGGFGLNGITNDITCCFETERCWKNLTVIPHVEQCNFGISVLNNELYVIGGCFNQSLQEVIHPYGFKYNPRTNSWQKIRSMLTERCRFTLNVIDTKLYAVAGDTDNGNGEYDGTKTAECYDLVKGTWEYIESLPECRQQHAGASFTYKGDNLLYISGGLHKEHVIASMFSYSVQKNTWTSCAPLLTPRADHFMVSYNYKLYACGGWREDPETRRTRIQVATIDSYDVVTNTWTFVTTIPTPRYHTGVVAHTSKIYFIGGFHTDALFHRDVAAIECYDISTDTWTIGEKNPQDFWEHSCAVMYIPKNRKEEKWTIIY